jgi:uncharacterized protein (TIGR00159 family)
MSPVAASNFTSYVFPRLFGPNGLFHLTGNLYYTDLLDILLIAVFFYSLFFLFQKTRSFLILLGLATTVVFYSLAKIFHLYLTSLVLQYFFGVSIVVFVIIFQQEIRKYFELVGLVGTRQIKAKSLISQSPSTAEMLQACVKMAQDKIGALIVFQGRDDLDHLLEGGFPIDGVISEELILSIFDPHSYGHDGAVIINNNRISKFSVHLPLSNNFKEIGKHGTRHSAALGLSENSDAFCLVVSEEKGKISVCHNGRMKTLDNFSDLEKELNKFVREKFTDSSTTPFHQFIRHNFGLKTAALLSAGILWFFSAYQAGIITKSYTIPITFTHIPPDTLIQSYSPKEVILTVSGRGEISFNQAGRDSFAVEIDASSIKSGVNQLALSPANIKQPLNLLVTSIEPSVILLTANKYYSSRVSIRVQTQGQLARGYGIQKTTITPEQLDIWVPENTSPPVSISTEPIDISGKKESFVTSVNLILPTDAKFPKPEDSTVSVALTIGK